MIVKHTKTETLIIETDVAGLGPIEVKPLDAGAVCFCMKGLSLWVKPDDDGGRPHFGYVVEPPL